MKAMAHLGMRWTGAGHQVDGRKVLLAENLDSHRHWSIDPVTGIGEPLREGAVSTRGAEASQPLATSNRPERARTATHPLGGSEPATHRAGSAGPSACEHCGAKSVYQIRFSQTEFATKCLSCRRFVVDGRVERQGRSRPANRRGTSLWLPLE